MANNQGGLEGAPSESEAVYGIKTRMTTGLYMNDVLEPPIAGLYAAQEMRGLDCTGIPPVDTYNEVLSSGSSDVAPRPEGGATWLGKGSSKTPFPL